MEPTYIVIGVIVLVLAALAYFVLVRKPAAPPAVYAPPPPKKLQDKPSGPDALGAKPALQPEKPKPAEPKHQPKPEKPKLTDARPEPQAEKPGEAVVPEKQQPVEAAAESVKVHEKAAARGAEKPKERPAASTRRRDVEGLRKGLTKVREKEGFFGRLKALFAGKKEIDPNIVEQIEEVLLTSDVGVKTTARLLDAIKNKLAKNELGDTDRVWEALREDATSILSIGGGGITLSARPTVVLIVGVNGVGKTTTIGKLATKLKAEGKKVVLAAGDTFRAAAVQQLKVWGKRVDVEVVAGKDGADPGSVIHDAITRAREIGADVVLADTAGRLHTKTNLMDELTKVSRTMSKACEGAPHETLLVLDATNGQNALQQAGMFKEALALSGIVLTKLDGTAKGGVILGICAEYGLPVRYIGIGERAEDLRDFVPEEFVEAMLGQGEA